MAEAQDEARELTAAEQAMRSIEDCLARIERERARVRPEDWATLFRQMQAVLLQLATHPFVAGDMEAELLIERILRSEDLDQVDQRTDDFADYALRKLQYVSMLKAARSGEQVDAPRHVKPRSTTTEVTRAAAAAGPSGDDFAMGSDGAADPRPRRSLLRL